MQPILAPPRGALTEDQVRHLLVNSSSVTYSGGCDVLNPDLTVAQADVALRAGSVARQLYATVHGTCKLQLDTALVWGRQLARPFMVLRDGALSARFDLGVYAMTTPTTPLGESVTTYEVQGYDRLYLLTRPVGDSYSVAAGTDYLQAILNAVAAAGLSGVQLNAQAAGKTLPTSRAWPLLQGEGATTWLRIVNDLLQAIGYRSLWADHAGTFRGEPYVALADRPAEWLFDTGAYTIVGEERQLTEDTYAVPTRWVFVQQNRDLANPPALNDGLYEYALPDADPMSAASRGLDWPRVAVVEAADQASLVARGNAAIAADRRVARKLTVTTAPFPLAGHADLFTYDDPDLGPAQLVQASQWELDVLGADMTWTWESAA